jgi:hypothetical protein
MNDQSSTLVAHCGARKITREELRAIPVPEGTKTHQPLSHFEIVEVLEETLAFRHLQVVKDEYAVSADGMRMFGVMDLNSQFAEGRFSIGLRNSNDKSMRLALTAGYRVFVCDNMAFSGDFTPLHHKHTRNLELRDSISIAVDRIHRNFEMLEQQVRAMTDFGLTDNDAKLFIYRAFLENEIRGIPRNLMPLVHEHYFKPAIDAFVPRNLWSLSNAFTSAFKQLTPIRQFEVTARLGAFFANERAERTQQFGRGNGPKLLEQTIKNEEYKPTDPDSNGFHPEHVDESLQSIIDRLDEETEAGDRLANAKDASDETSRSGSEDQPNFEMDKDPIEFGQRAAA